MMQQQDTAGAQRYSGEELTLMRLEFGTAGAALGGGILLALRPDGAFLHADPSVLRRTPFRDWRLPGLLLAMGCGGGYLGAGMLHLRRHRAAQPLSVAAGLALIGLEAWEMAFIEFQPLEAAFVGIGAAVVVLALRLPPETPAPGALGAAGALPAAHSLHRRRRCRGRRMKAGLASTEADVRLHP
ncbi:hypothetical protein [Arthrobacter sp. zg-Y1171]|uniref:hypothetical protein n=1 Tax=Arthrobacter sp. zg-Y1171 TaxID=2964610 RepID=UPI00210720C6|nr:hypothetical protein [Arthrobacter sp. zg-Y1171]MCQ1995800.1 hypothetical protein [Arthrobacter sp. zg-Y1171]UWX83119.1 hypothetical protein N2L00_06865 [Arthrobacter sp. zg-Y1171]